MDRPGNQLHGKVFENVVQTLHGCPIQYFGGIFDLPSMYDNYGMQVQIKTANEKRNRIDLADASRFWRNQNPIHLFLGIYEQNGLHKIFHTINEYIIGVRDLATLKGNIPSWEVERVHDTVKGYIVGHHEAARNFAHSSIGVLEARYGIPEIMLNAKVDSHSQRRIQCSVKLSAINPFLIRTHSETFMGKSMPITITVNE